MVQTLTTLPFGCGIPVTVRVKGFRVQLLVLRASGTVCGNSGLFLGSCLLCVRFRFASGGISILQHSDVLPAEQLEKKELST